jgi:hypothetical protein
MDFFLMTIGGDKPGLTRFIEQIPNQVKNLIDDPNALV